MDATLWKTTEWRHQWAWYRQSYDISLGNNIVPQWRHSRRQTSWLYESCTKRLLLSESRSPLCVHALHFNVFVYLYLTQEACGFFQYFVYKWVLMQPATQHISSFAFCKRRFQHNYQKLVRFRSLLFSYQTRNYTVLALWTSDRARYGSGKHLTHRSRFQMKCCGMGPWRAWLCISRINGLPTAFILSAVQQYASKTFKTGCCSFAYTKTALRLIYAHISTVHEEKTNCFPCLYVTFEHAYFVFS